MGALPNQADLLKLLLRTVNAILDESSQNLKQSLNVLNVISKQSNAEQYMHPYRVRHCSFYPTFAIP